MSDTPKVDALYESDDCHSLGAWFLLAGELERELRKAQREKWCPVCEEKWEADFGKTRKEPRPEGEAGLNEGEA